MLIYGEMQPLTAGRPSLADLRTGHSLDGAISMPILLIAKPRYLGKETVPYMCIYTSQTFLLDFPRLIPVSHLPLR